MLKSLGDYRIENSSSSDINNIKWTHKNPSNTDKSKNKKKKTDKRYQNSSASNIIHTHKTKRVKPPVAKIFKVEKVSNTDKSKNKKKKADKRYQNSSASNCNIKQGFKRPAR